MAVGAQLRLVVLGGDAKHVVAGDADAVDNLLRLGCRFGFGFLFLSRGADGDGGKQGAQAGECLCYWRRRDPCQGTASVVPKQRHTTKGF